MSNSRRWKEFITWFKKECICSGGVRTAHPSEYVEGMIYLYDKINKKIDEIQKRSPSIHSNNKE